MRSVVALLSVLKFFWIYLRARERQMWELLPSASLLSKSSSSRGPSQGLGTQFKSPMQVAGIQPLEPPLLPPSQDKKLESDGVKH